MERESFENERIAALLNAGFVSVKVDREERPDIDEVYMSVCQAMTGSGGWPLTIIMTPDKKPFFAGTYLPPRAMYGRTGLDSLLTRVIQLWREERRTLAEHGEKVTRLFSETDKPAKGSDAEQAVEDGADALRAMYEPEYGGFSTAPKFPMPHYLMFLMREWKALGSRDALDMAAHTLKQMARGGIYDHVGGGFSRYSTDGRWLVPHFEKMLYDNALLLFVYAEMAAATGEETYRRTAAQTAHYLMRDMQSPDGGYYSAEDADSEGVEGKFYVWDETELARMLTADEMERLRRNWSLTAGGNFEGKTILNRLGAAGEPDDADAALLGKLYENRAKRVPPFKDKKVSASWNGLAIAAMARAGMALGDKTLVDSAQRAARFVITHMADGAGLVCGTYLDGPGGPAFLAGWANMAGGLLELFSATRRTEWLEKAKTLAAGLLRLFADEHGFTMSPKGGEELLTAPRDTYDGAMPSGSSCAVIALQRLYWLTGDDIWDRAYKSATAALLPMVERDPASHVHLLTALLNENVPHRQVVIAAAANNMEAAEAYDFMQRRFDPFTTAIWYDGSAEMDRLFPHMAGYKTDQPFAAYVCENFTCQKPVFSTGELKKALE